MNDAEILAAPAGFLDGHLLVAMPGMTDARFARAVVYLCAHSGSGAMGIVVNKRAPNLDFGKLLVQLEVIDEGEAIRLPKRVGGIGVMKGGPVETGRGFVLHTPDVTIENSTLPIDGAVCLTATVDILRAIARDEGPARAVLALGYAGWGAGQLEGELLANGWLTCEADASLIFDPSPEGKYERALAKIGIDPGMLSAKAGHA